MGELFICKECGAEYKRESAFKKHVCKLTSVTSVVATEPLNQQCQYCGKVFKRHSSFVAHSCQKKETYEMLTGTLQGKRAFAYYQTWLRLHTRLIAGITIDQFASSKDCTTFCKFSEWSKQVKLPDVDRFIRVMVSWKFHPQMWMMDEVYVKYIDFIDRTSTVDDHIRNTFNTLKSIAKVTDCSLYEAISKLALGEILTLVRARKLSPWVLLKMNSFLELYKGFNDLQKQQLVATINPKYWKEKFIERAEETQDIVEFVKVLNI